MSTSRTPESLDGPGRLAARSGILAFFEWVDRLPVGNERNSLAATVSHWIQYLEYLRVIGPRALTASAEARDIMDRFQASVSPPPGLPQGRSLTQDERTLLEDVHQSDIRTHLEIESFYVFAKVLLDRVADTFALYFQCPWRKLGSTHSQLRSTFPRFCTERRIEGGGIEQRLDDLSGRIVSYRTDVIEHLGPHGAWRGTIRRPGNAVSTIHLAGRESEELQPLMVAVDEYLLAVLAFMKEHARHSILACHLQDPAEEEEA